MQYTLDDIQRDIALRFEFASAAPGSGSEHYNRVLGLINDAERSWADELNYRWPQLYTSTTLSTVADTPTVALPSGYSKGRAILGDGGYISINGTDYKVIDVSKIDDYASGARIMYITGNDAIGYTLNISPTPTEAQSFTFRYYTSKLATDTTGVTEKDVLALGTDITKCNVPRFITYYVLAELYLVDETNINAGVDYQERAAIEMEKALNALHEEGQIDVIEDQNIVSGYGRLGSA